MRAVGALELRTKTRRESIKVLILFSTANYKNLKGVLNYINYIAETRDNIRIKLYAGMVFHFNNRECEIAQVSEDYVISKSRTNDEEMKFRRFLFASNAHDEKLE